MFVPEHHHDLKHQMVNVLFRKCNNKYKHHIFFVISCSSKFSVVRAYFSKCQTEEDKAFKCQICLVTKHSENWKDFVCNIIWCGCSKTSITILWFCERFTFFSLNKTRNLIVGNLLWLILFVCLWLKQCDCIFMEENSLESLHSCSTKINVHLVKGQ